MCTFLSHTKFDLAPMNTENPKNPLQAEYISCDLTFKNNHQTVHPLRKHLGVQTTLVRLVLSNRRKLRGIATTYCRNTLEGKHGSPKKAPLGKKKVLKADCKTALLQGQQREQQKE